jgi:ABC-2 type transport system permease protein
MVELTGPDSVPGSLPPIPASAQLLAVAWLRWRIFVNGVFRKRPKGKRQIAGLVFATLLRLIVWPVLALIVVGPVAASGFFAWMAVSQGHPQRLASLLLGIALLWQFVSVNGLSIAATIPSFDPASLVRFPLRFGRYFVLRSLLGFMTPSTIVGCLAVLAAAVGIGVANASLALPAVVVMPVYALMNIYLTRMIGAWMERWLANRRFREIFSMLMALFAVSIQFLNLRRGPLQHDSMRAPGVRSSWLINIVHSSGAYLYWLPSGFAAQAILLVKHPLAALAQFAGLLASTALFASVFAIRLHKQFLGEHLGEGVSRRVKAPLAPRVNAPAPQSAALSTPAASGAIFSPIMAACLRKEWLILRSNGTQLIGLLTPLLFVVIFSMNHAFSAFSTKYFLPSAIAYVLIAALSSLYNIFGADGRGVQFYLLAPVRMLDVVLAKNLMSLAIIVTQVVLAWVIICVMARVSIPVSTQVSTALWTVFVVAMNLALGTLRSIQAPRHFVPGQGRQLRTTPTNRTSALLVLAVLFGSMLLQIPVTMASSYLKQPWLAAWVFGPLAVAAVCAYALMLRNAERLILAHRDVFAEELCKA